MWRTFPLWVKSARFHVRFSSGNSWVGPMGIHVPELQSICFRTEANPGNRVHTLIDGLKWGTSCGQGSNGWWSRAFKTKHDLMESQSQTRLRVEQQQCDLVCSCCCSVAKSCLILCDLMDCSMPGFPVLYLPDFAQTQWCHPAVSSSVTLFSSCPQSFPESESFPVNWLFTWGGQNIGTSASASVLPMNTL